MKKLLLILLSVLLILPIFSLTGCADGDRYELTSVYGLGVSVDAYEYNYIDFNFDKKTYTLKNKVKANGIVTKQTGTFKEDMFGGITITNNEIPSQDYILYNVEILLFSDDYSKFYASATIYGTEVIMIYTKK